MATTTATILSTDVAGSTAVRTDIGEAAADELFRSHHDLLGEITARHRGKVVKTAGDGILAAFDSASAAVIAATAMLEAVSRDSSELAVRIGIAAGDVSWEDEDCFGLPVVTATRLQSAAEPNQILVSGVVRALTGDRAGATLNPVGSLDLKGIPEPVEVYEVAWQPGAGSAAPPPLPPMLGSATTFPFVAREREWAELERAWAAVEDGATALVLLSGEPGAGKTRLATEFARRCHETGAAVLYGCCDERSGPPYQPWVQVLSQLLRTIPPTEIDPATLGDIGELAPMIPQLSTLGESRSSVQEDPTAQQFRLYNAVGSVLESAGQRWPMVLIVDDLHWGTTQTLGLLSHIARSGSAPRALVLGAFRELGPGGGIDSDRDEPLVTTLADLRRLGTASRINVGALDAQAVAALIQEGGTDDPVHPRLARLIAAVTDQSGGNAFYVGELWRHLIERGVLVRAGDRWLATGEVDEAGIPDSVREVVAGRLRRLDHRARRLAELAAVAGQRIELRVLRAAADLTDADAALAVDSLMAAGLVEAVEQPNLSYRFGHALVREAVVEGVPPATRARLHLRLAEALEQVHESDHRPVLADLARNFAAGVSMAGPGKALHYLRRAADQAIQSYAYDDAAAHLRTALDIAGAATRERVALLIQLAVTLSRSGRHLDAIAASSEAFDAALTLGDAKLVAEAALCSEESIHLPGGPGERSLEVVDRAIEVLGDDGSALRARLEGARSRALSMVGRAEEATGAAQRAVALAREAGDDAALAGVLPRLLTVPVMAEDLPEIVASGIELQELAQRLNDPWIEQYATAATLRAHLTLGDVEAASRQLTRHREIAERSRFYVFEFMAECIESTLALIAGDIDAAERIAHRGQSLGEDLVTEYDAGVYGLQMFTIRREQGRLGEVAPVLKTLASDESEMSVWRPGLAILYVELGMLEDARRAFDSIIAAWGTIPRDGVWPATLTFTVETCLALGDAENADRLYEELSRFQGLNLVVAFTTCLGPADRLLGGLAALAGHRDTAAHHFDVAMTLAERCNAPRWQARIRTDRDRWLTGQPTRRPTQGGATPWPDGLSTREVEVLRLVAAGRSNREIGDVLFISGHTAANHVRSILQKTGSANRAEAATYAARRGLLGPRPSGGGSGTEG
jgi:class 3 adenylate cyclase/DNA-binding CsgD family transcriptional regulator